MSPMVGQLVCRVHGGSARQNRKAGERRTLLAEVQTWAAKLVKFDPEDKTPADDILMRQIRWSNQVTMAYAEAIDELQGNDLTQFGRDKEHLAALIEAWTIERGHLGKLVKIAIEAGIEQQRLDLEEKQASFVVQLIVTLLQSSQLGLSGQQVAAGKQVAARLLAAAPS